MIDESRTFEIFGYDSSELTRTSHKRVVAVCEDCGKYRETEFKQYSDLCVACSKKGKLHPGYGTHCSEETKCKIRNTKIGSHHTEETKTKMRESKIGANNINYGRAFSKEHRQKISEAGIGKHPSEETRQRMSAARQGIPYEEWESYACKLPYCPRFDEECRESNREKYGRRCFICDLPESENVDKTDKQWKLAVHHVDMNKNQGCDGVRWKLVPVCLKHHNHSRLWANRIMYLLDNIWNEYTA